MELLNYFQNRHSVRSYTGAPVPEDQVEKVLQAGLMSATGKGIRPWEFVVVRSRETLNALAECRTAPVKMLRECDCAIVVLGDESRSDVWVEDCSVAMANMHLMADGLGLGSCWVQGRLREAADGRSTEDFVRSLLGFPEHLRLEAILTLGIPAQHPDPHRLEELPLEKIHREKF